MTQNILVIGAGIIGLTTSIKLAEAGHNVTVCAQEIPSSIVLDQNRNDNINREERKFGTYTSSGSGGLWMPSWLEGPKIETWAKSTFLEYQSVLQNSEKDAAGIGIFLREGLVLFVQSSPSLPWYSTLTNMKVVKKDDDERVPVGYSGALCFTTPILQMELYLPYLERRARTLGVHFHCLNGAKWTLTDAREFGRNRNIGIFVNCTGVHAASFLESEDDLGIFPGRGILAFIKRPSRWKNYFIKEDYENGILSGNGKLAYALPRGNDIYTLGGTVFKGDWNESSTETEIAEVIDRAYTLLQIDRDSVEVCSSWTGLRPMTKEGSPRVKINGKHPDVIDNYGHGGNGVTTCWGCAGEVLDLVNLNTTPVDEN